MFGTLRVRPCALTPEPRQRYRELYCGTCKALGTHHGTASRALLSYDVVALAAVIEGLAETRGDVGSCRCPANPLVFKATLEPDTLAMRVASAVQVVLADEWLADQAADVGAPAGWARALLHRDRALAELRAVGLDPAPLEGLSDRQVAAELHGGLDAVVAPTAGALGGLLAQVPTVVGRGDPEVLRALGQALGAAIYWVDALEDLRGDARAGRFNPGLVLGVPSPERVAAIAVRLHTAVEGARSAVRALGLERNAELLEAALAQVGRRARLAEGTAMAHATAEAQAELAVWRARAWPVRLAFTLWAWLAGRLGGARSGQHTPESLDDPPEPRRERGSAQSQVKPMSCTPCEVCVGCVECGDCCGSCGCVGEGCGCSECCAGAACCGVCDCCG
ncbi:MAG: hypothetical protein ACI8PZ_002815 [Myxococcota bacterium]|jgi:hypothetical protein